MAGGVVASSPHGDLEPLLLSEGQRGCDVLGVNAARDRRRLADDQQVETKARAVVLAVAVDQDVALERIAQLSNVRHLRACRKRSRPHPSATPAPTAG